MRRDKITMDRQGKCIGVKIVVLTIQPGKTR